MFKKMRTIIVVGALGLLAMGAFVPVMVYDLAHLGYKEDWTIFDKIRVKSYFEPAGWVGALLPPIGKIRGVHHAALIGDAYFDGHLPPDSSMDFFRDVVMNAPGNGRIGSDFKSRFKRHEQQALRSGKRVHVTNLVQPVSFHAYGLPFQDHFAVSIRTDVISGKPQSSFIVWGLGIIVDHRNPAGLGGQYDEVASLFNLKGADLIRWTCHVEKEGLAKPYWILVTERPETSAFSYEALRKGPAQRKADWHRETNEIHKSGLGNSVDELYEKYRY